MVDNMGKVLKNRPFNAVRTKSDSVNFGDSNQFQQLIGWNRPAKIEPLILKATYFS